MDRLTKEIESEVLQAYKAGWDHYYRGDMDAYADALSEDYQVVGSSEGENFDGKEEWMDYCRATLDQFAGVIRMENQQLQVLPAGEHAMVVEKSDAYVLIDNEWRFYAHARITTLLRKEAGEWKFYHQHGSFPDSRANEGEVIAAKKIKEENELLKDAVKRRTIELEFKNRELSIEASLEKVRAVAMGMKKADDLLNICEVLFKEFEALGFTGLRNVVIQKYVDEQSKFFDYDYSDYTKGAISQIPYTGNSIIEKFIRDIRRSKDAFTEIKVAGEELDEWKKFRIENNEAPDERLDRINALYYYIYSIGVASIGVSTVVPVSTDQIGLLKRFRNVFDLAYARYVDISNAEAQAREATIEAALEKVRSRSLAMHKSEELKEVVAVLFDKLKSLDIPVTSVGINLYVENSKDTKVYVCGENDGQIVINKCLLPHFSNVIAEDLLKVRNGEKDFFIGSYSEEEKNNYYNYLFEHSDLKYLPDEIKGMILHSGQYKITMLPVKNSMITVNDFQNRTLSQGEVDVLKRFARIFDQSYIRFLDLQKAEAQARESQIQLALERVRARTMAMQRSEELGDASTLLDQQVRSLGIETWGCAFNIYNEHDSSEWFSSGKSKEFKPYRVPRENIFRTYYEIGQQGETLHIKEFAGQVCVDHYEYLCSLPVVGDGLKRAREAGIAFPTKQIDHVAYFRYGYLLFITLEPVPEAHDIFKRFAAVFEQTYTRFLDLQKAEAQSREGQIQLALERVRARTMAMQRSDELIDAANVMFQQVESLGAVSWNCGFNIWDEDKKFATSWNGSKDGLAKAFRTPSSEDVFQRFYEAEKRGESLYIEEIGGKELVGHYNFMRTLPGVGKLLADFEAVGISLPEFQIFHIAYFSQGYLMFITYEPVPHLWDIFRRFAKVFEQTYTRFLDLQKSEAQAREAQINLAVERVRARALAMFKSEEILDVVMKMKEELMGLQIPSVTAATVHLKEKDGRCRIWDITFEEDLGYNHPIDIIYDLEKTDPGFFMRRIWANNEKYFLEIQDENDFPHTLQWLRDYGRAEQAEDTEKLIQTYGIKRVYHPTIQLINGRMSIDLLEAPAPEIESILEKMGAAFDLAYKRFEDLKNSEAQLKEARVEASLERVRSIAMSMMKTDDLPRICESVFTQLSGLGFDDLRSAQIYLRDDAEEKFINYDYSDELGADRIEIKYNSHPNTYRIYDVIKNAGDRLIENVISKEEMNSWKSYLYETLGQQNEDTLDVADELIYYLYSFGTGAFGISTFRKINEDELEILKRFRNVFSLSYKRYSDIAQAEAQTREAQIEAALEKVRSRSLAMHHSDEIGQVVWTTVEKLKELNIELNAVSLVTFLPDSKDSWHWHVNPEQPGNSSKMLLPYFDDQILRDCMEAKANGVELLVKIYSKEEKNNYFDRAIEVSDFKYFPENLKHWVREQPHLSFSFAVQKHSGIFLEDYSGKTFTDEENKILVRFSKVFEQAYVRFLDLQKSEAQAREAQIELSLERIRAKVTAMKESSDLLDIVVAMRHEFVSLGHDAQYFWHMRWLPEVYEKAMTSGDGTRIGMVMSLSRIIHKNIPLIDNWEKTNEPSVVYAMDAETAVNYVDQMISLGNFTHIDPNAPGPDAIRAIGGITFIMARTTHGEIGYSLPGVVPHPPEEDVAALVRFAAVFDLACRRFEDLKSAELQNREAKIELALERVRARTLAMQKSEELAETAAVLFQQLIGLGIEPNRLYIATIKDDKGTSEFWITDEDGTKVSTAYTANLNDNSTFRKMYEGWKRQLKSLVIDMHGEELETYFNHLTSLGVPFKGGLQQKRRVQDIAFFSHGFIGIASPEEQPAESLQLLERFAYVFNLTYTRFNDLKLAEAHALQAEQDLIEIKAARKKAEEALTELQLTQGQLIQKEKMASLGELTAGIAHEIQNPLNFVNNFSEVSAELIDEVEEAIEETGVSRQEAEGNSPLILELLSEIKENLSKINHHGKRADAIVKGMLQHSRQSGGEKAETSLNAFCDEWVRLAYHGFRAKDHLFNAEIKTDFDENIHRVKIIPQDMGRVILNLLNNAFYAVREKEKEKQSEKQEQKQNEKQKQSEGQTVIDDRRDAMHGVSVNTGYQPKVFVSTKLNGKNIEITVRDNGNGISKGIVDKIFHPFFTTKPTGQGTGLGLSLSYDIITKGHGGELSVETIETESTKFIIQLPY